MTPIVICPSISETFFHQPKVGFVNSLQKKTNYRKLNIAKQANHNAAFKRLVIPEGLRAKRCRTVIGPDKMIEN
jgi:hypothetical protein